jgi:hypothetical protein
MDRNTIVLTKNYTKLHLGTILDYYGPHTSAKLFPTVLQFQNDAKMQPRPWYQYTKNGRVKAVFKNKKIYQTLETEFEKIPVSWGIQYIFEIGLKIAQRKVKNDFKQKNCAAIILQKYVQRWHVLKQKEIAKKFITEGTDFLTDCISADSLKIPVCIKPDFKAGNVNFYNLDTVLKLAKMKRIPMYTIIENDMEYLVEYEMPVLNQSDNPVFVSPMTRREFVYEDVEFLQNRLWFRLGNKMVSNTTTT